MDIKILHQIKYGMWNKLSSFDGDHFENEWSMLQVLTLFNYNKWNVITQAD